MISSIISIISYTIPLELEKQLKPVLAETEKFADDMRADFNFSDAKQWSVTDADTNVFLDEEMLTAGKSVATQLKLVWQVSFIGMCYVFLFQKKKSKKSASDAKLSENFKYQLSGFPALREIRENEIPSGKIENFFKRNLEV